MALGLTVVLQRWIVLRESECTVEQQIAKQSQQLPRAVRGWLAPYQSWLELRVRKQDRSVGRPLKVGNRLYSTDSLLTFFLSIYRPCSSFLSVWLLLLVFEHQLFEKNGCHATIQSCSIEMKPKYLCHNVTFAVRVCTVETFFF